MSHPIRRVAVLGAGVMGSGIAAHVANAGLPVLLLDIVPPKLSEEERKDRDKRNSFAAGALAKMLKTKPAAFSHPTRARLLEVGNFDDDLERVRECDLVLEAIIEKLDIKRALFDRLEKILAGTDAVVASNTSGLRIVDMLVGRSEHFRRHFLVTHFFNPPRYMKLLELVTGPDTAAAALARVEHLGRELLGKGIVQAKDTPNFVANRIGAHGMMATIHLMLELGLTPEDVDQITGTPMGHPKSATFRTGDMVGLDTLAHVVDNCFEVLTDDEDRAVFALPGYVRELIKAGRLGDKTRAGFYRKAGKDIETLDPKTGEYRGRGGDKSIRERCKSLGEIEDPAERIRKLVSTEGVVGDFAWRTVSRSLCYAAWRVGEISDDVAAIDEAMRWGYNWELGPFQIWDALGFAETVERMQKDGLKLPDKVRKMHQAGAKGFYDKGRVYDLGRGDYHGRKRDPRTATLAELRQRGAPVLKCPSGEAWDIGEDVLAVTFTSKANSLDGDNIKLLHEAVACAERDFRGLLLFNRGDNFCVGANLFLVAGAAAQKQFSAIEELVKAYQDATQRMKYALVPVVAAPFGMTLGGGLELCYGSDAVQAAFETYAGLVEVGVGLIPGGAGTLNMLWRALGSVPEGAEVDVQALVVQVFKNIAMAKVATSADEALRFGFFRPGDGVSFDRERQLWEARQKVLELSRVGYHPPAARAYKLPGESGIATLTMMVNALVGSGYATEHDGVIAKRLARVLCGGAAGHTHEVTECELLALEREAFVGLCGEPRSQERMQYMLMQGKPLRN